MRRGIGAIGALLLVTAATATARRNIHWPAARKAFSARAMPARRSRSDRIKGLDETQLAAAAGHRRPSTARTIRPARCATSRTPACCSSIYYRKERHDLAGRVRRRLRPAAAAVAGRPVRGLGGGRRRSGSPGGCALLVTLTLLVLAASAAAQTKPPLPVSDLAGEWHGQWTAPTGYPLHGDPIPEGCA